MNETGTANKGTNVQVAVRCRPVNAEERKSGQPSVVTCDSENKSIKIAYGPSGKKQMKNFTFDKVFGMYSRQEEVFDSMVRPIVDECLEGFNCTIFAYGQTGTGKTHTMEGNIHSEEDAGIVPRSVKAILENLEASGSEFTIRVSFLELYNEELQDLLNISGDKKLKLCEDVKKGVVCQNLEEITVLNAKDIFDILQRGIQQRQTAATLCNKNSSRSHSIFTMKIMIKECNVEGEEVIRHGQLNLVDLAGSECIGRSGAKNDRAREAGSINQSLLTLGRVITALVDHHGHIPYRDSKLTRLLQESLGGKAKTCIIATLSPSQSASEESMSTLDYAYRAKSIKNQPTVNQRMTKKTIMKEYLAEVETLKLQLMQTREKNGVYMDPAEFYALETRLAAQDAQLEECEGALSQRTEEVKLIRRERDEYFAGYESAKQELAVCAAELDDVKLGLNEAKEVVSEAFVELKASEAVIGEQKATESLLHTQGKALEQDLANSQRDVSGLLDKVSRVARSEELKLRESAQFVTQLNASTKELASQVQNLSNVSGEHAGTLNTGVSQMLHHGRETCSSLKAAISSALTTMIGDAEQARDEMVTSCTGLKGHLQNTNQHLEATLRSLQGQLSEWLGEVDVSMQRAQEQLALQEKQIAVASATVAQHCVQLTDLSDSFIAQQELQHAAAAKVTEELQSALIAQFCAYEKKSKEMSQQASSLLQNQAAAMENAMKVMLKEMVTAGSAAFEASSSHSASMVSSSAQRLAQGVDSLLATQQTSLQSGAAHSESMAQLIATTSSTFQGDMDVISSQRTTADSTLAGVSGMVGSKRKFLDCTVTDLCGHVDAAIQQGVEVVDKTSFTASKVLSDVSTASQDMNASASSAMDTFTGFMDKEGEALRSGLQAHFSIVSAHAGAQSAGFAALLGEAGAHAEAMDACRVQVTGATPRKVQSASFEGPFKRTRGHGGIRQTARSNVLESQPMDDEMDGPVTTVRYEVAKTGIAECVAQYNSCADADNVELAVQSEPLSLDVPVNQEPQEEPTPTSDITSSHVRNSSLSSSRSSASSTRLSKDSAVSECAAAQAEAELEADIAMENANPNITNSRSSRGVSGKGRSKIATLGTRSSRSNTLSEVN